jgi:arylsulfatase A-like enzyme
MATVRFWRRSLPWVVSVVLLTLAAIQGRLWLQEQVAIATLPPAPSESPNILVILVDALRADHLSCYGYARPTSPHVDRITQQGVLFEKAFPTSSWTLPSHASLLTGRYPYEHGADWSRPQALLDRRHPTLAEALRSRGYRTGAFSANLFWFTRPMGFGRGFIRFEDYFHSIGDMASRTLYGRVIEKFVLQRLGFEDIPARKRASDINRALLNWADGERNKPFFAFLNYMDTHDPYLPPQPYRDQFSKLKNPGGILNWRVGRHHPPMTAEQLQSEIDAYDGAVAYVDDHIGKLLMELQKRGLTDNMLVVITSDHGESFGEHGVFLHGNGLYREEIQVPLIFWWPGQVPAGVRVAWPITNAALPATVMELLGAADQTVFPGPSLSSLWKASQAYSNFPYPLAEIGQIPWAPENAPTHHGSMISLVSPQWHYIEHAKLGLELYTWENDPRERHNLADRSELQNVVSQLRLRLPQTSSGMERGPILHGRPTEHSEESRH